MATQKLHELFSEEKAQSQQPRLSRVYHTILHFDIKDGKIWLQQNTTDIDVGQELIDMGVPKEDIVLGLHPAYKRPYTGYGVA